MRDLMTTMTSFDNATEPEAAATDQLFHTVRSADGRWQELIGLGQDNLEQVPAGFVGASVTTIAGALMLVGVGTDGELYHSTREFDGSWHPFHALRRGGIAGGPADFYSASCAGIHGVLHLIGQGSDGLLYHTVRFPDGRWRDYFELIDAEVLGGPSAFSAAACAADGDCLQVVALDVNGQLHHTLREADGNWQQFRGLGRGQLYDAPARFVGISCATVGGCLHIVGAGADGRLYHTIRWPDGTWQRYFGVLGGQQYGGAPHFALSVGCARVGHALEVVAIGSDNRLFHATRRPDGSWRESLRFGAGQLLDGEGQFLEGAGQLLEGSPAFYDVSCAGTGNALHVVGGTWQGGFA
jgi:hypothetical protein